MEHSQLYSRGTLERFVVKIKLNSPHIYVYSYVKIFSLKPDEVGTILHKTIETRYQKLFYCCVAGL